MSEEAVSKRGQEKMSNGFSWGRKRELETPGLGELRETRGGVVIRETE